MEYDSCSAGSDVCRDGEHVVVVDERDRALGTMNKMVAHRLGILHRAVSVLVVNAAGDILLQKRSASKYHSPGLWANACCTHPRRDEEPTSAACRRLREEVGLIAVPVPVFTVIYRIELGGGMIEHEYDHVYVAHHEGPAIPNASEVESVRWACRQDLMSDIAEHPSRYAVWFMIILDRLARHGPS